MAYEADFLTAIAPDCSPRGHRWRALQRRIAALWGMTMSVVAKLGDDPIAGMAGPTRDREPLPVH
jgi:hypothetical protein